MKEPKLFYKIFLEHPDEVHESYTEHASSALCYSFQLLKASGAACIHAFIPSLCKTTASRTVKQMYENMMQRNLFSDANKK
jgi:Family of unknown function (DUF6356)